MKKISVTVLAGFFGSGKTTVRNRTLIENYGKRSAVIGNEFDQNMSTSTRVAEASRRSAPS